jgi:TolB protein
MIIRILIVIFFTTIFNGAHSLKIEINKGQVQPDPIAIVDFYDGKGGDSEVGNKVCEIIRADLKSSGLFSPVNSSLYLEDLREKSPNIKNWIVIGTRFLVYGKVGVSGGSVFVNFKLLDVMTGNEMLSLEVSGRRSELRSVSHIIADRIYERITNEEGYFNTSIVYVETVSGIASKDRKTRLVMIGQDGFGRTDLTDGSKLNLTPRYMNKAKLIAYISCNDKSNDALDRSAHVHIMDPKSGSRKLMINERLMRQLIKKNHGNPVQMTYAPHFSPDDESAVLSIIIDGKSAIYKIRFSDNLLEQLTEHHDIDTSPCFSHDGKMIVFTSNRQGREAIYVMNADGSDQRKISANGGKYSQPVWSPRGDLIAFTKQVGRRFFIGVMNPDGSGERLIASGYLAEAPCWSSNGRYLVYSMESRPGARSTIAVVDITGHYTRIIETKGDASCPAWSPTVKAR